MAGPRGGDGTSISSSADAAEKAGSPVPSLEARMTNFVSFPTASRRLRRPHIVAADGFTVNIVSDAPVHVLADQNEIFRVLFNLLHNAMLPPPAGAVHGYVKRSRPLERQSWTRHKWRNVGRNRSRWMEARLAPVCGVVHLHRLLASRMGFPVGFPVGTPMVGAAFRTCDDQNANQAGIAIT